jgi:hypothetical protein
MLVNAPQAGLKAATRITAATGEAMFSHNRAGSNDLPDQAMAE